MSTTQKLNTFLSRPLRDCALREVPGVGEVAHDKIVAASEIDTAEKLIGQFLLLGRERSQLWLRDACGVRSQEAQRITDALQSKTERLVCV